ncbi:MAG: rhomboid family intramembrane serine protease [Hyphomonadaceae bacterium]
MYEAERIPTPLVVWLLTGSIVLASAALFFAPTDTQHAIDYAFALIPERYHPDSPYRFATWCEAMGPIFGHAFLHLNWFHLGINAVFLAGASRLPALRLGTARYLLVVVASLVTDSAVFIALNWDGNASAVGASGAVCGMFTAFFFSLRRTWREALADPQVRGPLGMLFLINVPLFAVLSKAGIFPIAWEGHLGGFIGGGVAYAFLQPRPPSEPA